MEEAYYRGLWDGPRIKLQITNSANQLDLTGDWQGEYAGSADSLFIDGIGM